MLGAKIDKNNYNQEEYEAAVKFCDENNCIIVDRGEYYEVVAIKEPTEEERQVAIQQRLTVAVQNWMDTNVQKRNYDNIHTACTYAYSTDETFKAEGTACLAWRDNVWRTCYNILDDVLSGKREIPTEEELIVELPKLEW